MIEPYIARMAVFGDFQGLGGEIKLFPPPVYHGESEKWEDWSWQLKSYVALYKPMALEIMGRLEGASVPSTDEHLIAFEHSNAPNSNLIVFSKQLHYLLAQITDGSARLVVRLNEHGNGFETWRQLYERFSLPDRARGVSLLSRILDFKLRDAHFEADLTEFISLKNKHEKATGRALDDDLLVTLMVTKTSGSLQQHLRLNVDALTTFSDVLQIMKQYYQSRHLANWRTASNSSQGPAPMDIGALKGKGKYRGKGKGKSWNWNKGKSGKSKGKGFKGKGKGKGGKGKGFKGKGKGKGKSIGKGTGCFVCGSPAHWSKECPHAKQGAVYEEGPATIAATQEGNVENDWNWDWNDDDASWWYGDWQGALVEDDWWYDDWCDDDYSWWSDDWSYDWFESGLADQSQSQTLLQPQTDIARASGAIETAAAVMTSPVIEESQEEEIGETEELVSSSNPLFSQRREQGGIARPSQPGLLSKMFIGALMLIGVLSTGVPARVESIEQTTDDCLNRIEQSSQSLIDPPSDTLAEFHLQSGIVDKSWVLFDSGASANCCPPRFAEDYPLLPVGSDCPALRSISGKSLNILGKRVVELDCNGHSLCIQFYVCENIPFPLVSVSRFLLQDFWTVMSRDFMALITPTGLPVPIVRQGTLVYLTPTVIPFSSSDAPKSELEINSLMAEIDLTALDVELRGVTDIADLAYDHVSKISSLIAAAQKGRQKQNFKHMDYWEVDDKAHQLIRHHVKPRSAMFDLGRLSKEMPVDEERLTGRRETRKSYKDGSRKTVIDADFRSLEDSKAKDDREWTGSTRFALKQRLRKRPETSQPPTALKPQPKTSPKPEPSQALKPSSEALQPSSSPIERRVLSRGTEVLETLDSENTILSRLRSVQVFDNKMKEDLLRLFHTPDPLTGMERTTDYWVQLPTFWIRMIHQKRTDLVHPDDEPSPIDAKRDNEFGDSLMADRYTYIVESQFPESNGTEIEDYWCSVRDDDGTVKEPEQDPRRDLFQAWRGFSVFVPIPIEYERTEQETSDRHARVPKGLKVTGEPSSSERKQHELTHLPFRDWCPHCVKAKGRHGPAKKQIDRQPVIQVDYCFSATNKDLPLQKILSAVDVISGLGMAVVVPSKGEIDYSVAELKKFIFECGRTFGVLQYDQESPLKALCQRVCSELGGLSCAPKEHSQSSGSVGQMQRTLHGQLRTLLYQVEHNTGFAIDSNSALYPWAVKHAQWLINRYLVHSDGFTSYFRRWNRNYDTTALKRMQDADTPLEPAEHAKYRTAVGKLLWLAFFRPDCSYAVKELSRDVKSPTLESLAKLKHLLRYIVGTKQSVLRLRPSQMLADWRCTLDIACYVDSDWAGCSRTRKSTSGSTVQVLDCDVIHSSRTQATVALSSGEANCTLLAKE